MRLSPIGLLNGQGGELLIEIIQRQGGIKAFPKRDLPTVAALERLADDGYLETLQETPETITYQITAH